jgi:hypothetical protein
MEPASCSRSATDWATDENPFEDGAKLTARRAQTITIMDITIMDITMPASRVLGIAAWAWWFTLERAGKEAP